MLKHIPNILSSFRAFLSFVFIFVFLYNYPDNVILAVIVFLIAGITDIIDGNMARKFNLISDFGKIIDPIADKLMQVSVLLSLTIKNIIPLWFSISFIIKEILVLLSGVLLYEKTKFIAVSTWYGKSAVVIFYSTMTAFMLFKEYFFQHKILMNFICIFSLLYTIFALVMYLIKYITFGIKKMHEQIIN